MLTTLNTSEMTEKRIFYFQFRYIYIPQLVGSVISHPGTPSVSPILTLPTRSVKSRQFQSLASRRRFLRIFRVAPSLTGLFSTLAVTARNPLPPLLKSGVKSSSQLSPNRSIGTGALELSTGRPFSSISGLLLICLQQSMTISSHPSGVTAPEAQRRMVWNPGRSPILTTTATLRT